MEQVSNGTRNQLRGNEKQPLASEVNDGAVPTKSLKRVNGIKRHAPKLHAEALSVDKLIEEIKVASDGEKPSFDDLLKPAQKNTTKDNSKRDKVPLWYANLNTIDPSVSIPQTLKQFVLNSSPVELGINSVEDNQVEVNTDMDMPVQINNDVPKKHENFPSLKLNKTWQGKNKILPEVQNIGPRIDQVKVIKRFISAALPESHVRPIVQSLRSFNNLPQAKLDVAPLTVSVDAVPEIAEVSMVVTNDRYDFSELVVGKNLEKTFKSVDVLANSVSDAAPEINFGSENLVDEKFVQTTEQKIDYTPMESELKQAEPILPSVVDSKVVFPELEQNFVLEDILPSPMEAQKIPEAFKADVNAQQLESATPKFEIKEQAVKEVQTTVQPQEKSNIATQKPIIANKVTTEISSNETESMQVFAKPISKHLTKKTNTTSSNVPLKNIENKEDRIEVKPSFSANSQPTTTAKKPNVELPHVTHQLKHLAFAELRPFSSNIATDKLETVNTADKQISNFSGLIGVEVTNVRKQGDLHQIDLVLKPEHLGKLVAKLRFTDKQMLVEIQTPNRDAAKSLLLNENLLREAIKKSGLSHKHEIKLIVSDKSGAVNVLHLKRNEAVAEVQPVNYREGLENFLGGNSDASNSERKKFKKKSKDTEIDLSAAPQRSFGKGGIEKVFSNNSDNLLII